MILAQCLIHQGLLFLAGVTTTLLLQIFSDRLTRKFEDHELMGPDSYSVKTKYWSNRVWREVNDLYLS